MCDNFSEKFYDWKITTLFYIAIHYLKALAAKRGIDIGQTHFEIEQNVNPRKDNASMRIKQGAWMEYKSLLNYSRSSRYDGIDSDIETFEKIMKIDYQMALKNLENFKKYLKGQDIKIK
ncbi:MAG: HEPN domain-containing protein [Cryomorphaceae bacterium]|nr:HEPN domain-containing protein [Cryomorphaceae bacterium]